MATISSSFPKTRRPAARAAKQVASIFGWTPGLRSLIAGRVLPCGCLSGIYETTSGGRVEILDGVGPACTCRHHEPNVILDPSTDLLD